MPLPVPSPRTFSVDEVEAASYLNSVRDALNFLINPPIAVVYQTSSQTVSNAGFTPLICDTTTFDTYGGHSNTVANSRYTAQVAGYYEANGGVSFGPNSTGTRGIEVYKNGALLTGPSYQALVNSGTSANNINLQVSGMAYLNAGDFLEFWVYQSSGSGLALATGASGFSIAWIHA